MLGSLLLLISILITVSICFAFSLTDYRQLKSSVFRTPECQYCYMYVLSFDIFLVHTQMITNNQQNRTENFTSGTNTEIPAVNSNWRSPSITQPTLYDYLTVLPAIIAAATPLILGLARKSDFFRKQDSRGIKEKQQSTENNDVSRN